MRMNDPRRLNGWTTQMIPALTEAFAEAAADEDTKVLVITGTDPYYSAGVNLGGTLKLDHPKKLHAFIVAHNQALFELFLNFPKPIIAAVNGPAIGAPVTSATLCDALLASDKATFTTPFARLGVAAEGCSSVHFARIMGEENAQRMLGPEGLQPTAAAAVELGLADEVVPHAELLDRAKALARTWMAEGRPRTLRGGSEKEELLRVNAEESVRVADSFLARPFLKGQAKFLWSKKKRGPALMFAALYATSPVWRRLL
ncbi:MAG: enoyl-CoA hydratase/isomerase family protein [Deltaproteobacteria bacterium]|nr:MAG: enoyl-CoA hydratase/isomerase family protein [Deltaproteobacteria bacterium]